MMGEYIGEGYGYMGGFGFFFMILFWGLIIWAIVAGVRMMSYGYHGGHHGGGSCCGGAQGDEAEKVLRARYAKGEITKEQFEQMKKDLSV
ncbi:MAG: SHOCT domain-containing protein [Candidatus Moranbacteria bacterium]|nr:SHOCT domain-containing protein [Candidatus Moranbacteria bacterium]PIP25335.1 MAG: electron transporter RnfE [Candidatus Moranbacteria bacterium CG23_combo_of_CG06-09_8_20_14_all_41_28]PIV86110.1 MAG: electron transporter RnfE [Candidatus Moranbacteria bacterium CG17_big_fil_post_rev_8_21_14_2_50_41_107]PIW93785.1 MAG: electron transporter RnfE [Candidatus Moranbacteria bacterium CG_4_8_14_3_um_filter_41_13]PIX91866.1 MAG: electron transporter RnfE [Candidatus Moranbacteria bacterium CG_4_1